MTILDEAPGRQEPASAPRRRRWRMPWGMFAAVVVMLLGVGLLEYPHVASWLSQYNQSKLIVDVAGEQRGGSSTLDAEIRRAREYNSLLESGALLAANANKPTSEAERVAEYDYDSLLLAAPSGVMGRLRVASVDIDLPIYHGTSDDTLTKGVGHLEGTSLPVGGRSQHAVLTAHRGLPEATLFDNLHKVQLGDRFTVELFGEVLTYEVIDTQVIEPEDTGTLRAVEGEDLVTLVTCTPLGINTHRYLVTATRVTPTPIEDVERAGERPTIPGFPWWALGLAAALLIALTLIVRAGFGPRRRPDAAAPTARDGEADPLAPH